MKGKKLLWILIAILIVLVGVIVFEKAYKKHVDDINTTDEVVVAIDKDTLTNVKWTLGTEKLEFTKDGEGWKYSLDEEFPVDTEKMEEFLSHFEEVHASFIIDNVNNFDQYGLENPDSEVTFATADGETVVQMGTYSTMDSKRYISTGDGKVYLIDDDLMNYITVERDEFMQNDEVPDFEQVESIVIAGATPMNAEYDPDGKYTYLDTYDYYYISDGGHEPMDNGKVESFIQDFKYINLSEYVTYSATESDISKYGLDKPVRTYTVRGTVKNDSEESDEADEESAEEITEEVILAISEVDEDEKDADGNPLKSHYARFGESEIIYEIDDDTYDILAGASYDSLRPREVATVDWSKVNYIEFELEGEKHIITAEFKEATDSDANSYQFQNEDEEYGYLELKLDGKAIEGTEIIDAVRNLSYSGFEGIENAEAGIEELKLTIRLDDEEYNQLDMIVSRYDGEDCIVSVNAEKSGFVSREDAVELREALLCAVLSLK